MTSGAGSARHRSSSSTSPTPPGRRSRNASTARCRRLPEMTPTASEAATTLTVSHVTPADSPQGIAGFHITYPQAGSSESVYSLPIEVWVVPAHAAPRTLRVTGAYRPATVAPVAIERDAVAGLHRDIPWARRSGFAIRLNALHLPRRFNLTRSVLLDDGTRCFLG